jgi:hypothetical protein
MSERTRNLARSRRRTAAVAPVTKLLRTNQFCQDGLHLWCDGTVAGHRHVHECLCECHKGKNERLRAAR